MKKLMIYPAMASLILASSLSHAANVYVESNKSTGNSILRYSLDDSGHLQAIDETPTGGNGVIDPTLALGPFDSDQEVITNEMHTLLFAVNSGSNTIAVFHIAADGKLTAVPGSPFASNGSNPVSVGLKDDILTVVNKHGDPNQVKDLSLPNYTNFYVGGDGKLKHVDGSTVEVPMGSSPSQALESPLGPFVFGADFLGGMLRSFKIEDDQLVLKSAMALPAELYINSMAPRLPLGLAAHPYLPKIYVGLPTLGAIAVYDYDHHGHLTFANATIDTGAVICWVRINAKGTRLYAANTGDPSISVYDLTVDPNSPREIQKIKINSMGGAYQFSLSPDEKTLVAVTQRFLATTPQGSGNELHAFTVDNETGLLSGMESSAIDLMLPTDVRPQGITISEDHMNWKIRPASISDEDMILCLYKKVAGCPGQLARGENEIDRYFIRQLIHETLESGLILALVSEADVIHGLIHAVYSRPESLRHVMGHLTVLIDPEFQRQGLGKKLFSRFLEDVQMKLPFILRVELRARSSNKRAIGLYESLGFKKEGLFPSRIRGADGEFEDGIPMAWINPLWEPKGTAYLDKALAINS